MATKKQKEELMEVLKFTPRNYKISMWGYGGEKVMGTVDRKIYDYFKARRLSLTDYAWDHDYADEHNIPEDMQPFPAGSWYECDDMAHAHGVSRNAGTLQIEDENGDTIFEHRVEDLSGWSDEDTPEPEFCGNDEVWINMKQPGTVVFIGNSNEKGTFFEGEIPLKQPFDITKLTLHYDEIDGEEIINRVEYDGEEIDNWGGSTDGKSSDFGFYIAGSQNEKGNWEKYSTMDDIEYTMTEWFPKKITPVREGIYMIKTPGKNSYTYQARWTGSRWISSWQEDNEDAESLKIKEWQGIAYDPDEQDLRDELTQIAAKWPFGAEVFNALDAAENKENEVTEESKSKWWTVKTYHKKNCEQQEYFIQRDGEGRIKVTDGFRWCEYRVETNDGEFPQFEFTTVPGGNAAKDSLDMNSLSGSNIESSELVEMFDGGCWGGWEITGVSEEEEEELNEFLEENGSWALEDDGKWYLDETEVWVWGPLEVSDDEGNTRIIIADEDGNVNDFKDE